MLSLVPDAERVAWVCLIPALIYGINKAYLIPLGRGN
jgi:hypothetical protein